MTDSTQSNLDSPPREAVPEAPRGGRKTRKRVLTIVGAILLIGAIASVCLWELWPNTIDRVLKNAPPNTIGVVHVDVKVVWEAIKKELQRQPGPMQAMISGALDAVVGKTESLDAFLLKPEETGKNPQPFFFIRSETGIAGLLGLQSILPWQKKGTKQGPFQTMFSGAQSSGNGRYTVGTEMTLINGKEANDVSSGVVLVGPTSIMTKDFLKRLGEGNTDALRKKLAEIDTTAPIWATAELDLTETPEAPTKIAGNVDLSGRKETKVTLTFRSPEHAEEFLGKIGLQGDSFLGPLAGIFKADRDRAVVTITPRSKGPLLRDLIASAMAASVQTSAAPGAMPVRVHSANNLAQIGGAIVMYTGNSAHEGSPPPDLQALVKEGLITWDVLISPASERVAIIDEDGNLTEQSDYIYIKLPPEAPGNLIRAYERLENYDDEGTNVLFVDFRVEWLDAEDFQRQLQETKDWLDKHKQTVKTD